MALQVKEKRTKGFKRKIGTLLGELKFRIKPIASVLAEKLMIGAFDVMSLEEWIQKSKDYTRISVLLKDSPYVSFLKSFKDKKTVDKESFVKSDYFKMAKKCLEVTGHFFQIDKEEDLIQQGQYFLDLYHSMAKSQEAWRPESEKRVSRAHSDKMCLGYRIEGTDLIEIYDGHHRLAAQYISGVEKFRVKILGTRKTYIQKLVDEVRQTEQRKELYQPIEKPEFGPGWHVIRICKDRYRMMKNFLSKSSLKKSKGSVVDLASSYGWFVQAYKQDGWKAKGIERDPKASLVGRVVYGLDEKDVECGDVADYLMNCKEKFNVVLFFSILHHFELKNYGNTLPVSDVLKRLDAITENILFIDVGQNHEAWFRKKLKNWDEKYVIELIKKHTTFQSVQVLGHDEDARGKYDDNYKRALFACTRSSL